MDEGQITALIDMVNMRLGAIADGLAALTRAIQAQREEAEEETLQFTLGDYPAFDWSRIGAELVDRDDAGASMIRASNGKIARRRSNPKFGDDIWFSYAVGKNDDGTPRYHKVVEFSLMKAAEPLGRKVEAALKAVLPASPRPAASAAAAPAPAQPAPQPQQPPPPEDPPAAQVDPELAAARHEMFALLSEASILGIELTSATTPLDGDTIVDLHSRIATLRNMVRARRESGAPAGMETKAPVGPKTDALKADLRLLAETAPTVTTDMSNAACACITAIAGGEEMRQLFTRAVAGVASWKDLSPKAKGVLHKWLRPSYVNGKYHATNPLCAPAIADVLTEAKQVPAHA